MSGHDLLGRYTMAVCIDLVRKVTSFSNCPRLDNWSNLNIYIFFYLKTDEPKREQKVLIGVQH